MKKWVTLVILVAVLWGGAVYTNTSGSDSKEGESAAPVKSIEESPQKGFKAPAFTLTGLDGKRYSLESLKAKPVVINFWASWCPPCRAEAPDFVKLYDQYQGDLEILAVNLTINDSVEGARAFADEFGFTFPVLLDKEGKVALDYRVQAIPTSFFVNKDGIIVDQIIGFGGSEMLKEKFKNFVSGS